MAKISINVKEGTLNTFKKPKNIIVGIDLGTTNSLVAYIEESTGEAVAITDATGSSKLVPSIIHFGKQTIVGNKAKSYLLEQPENTIYSVKRLMGKSYNDIEAKTAYFNYKIIDDNSESLVKIKVGKQFFTPIELSAHILRALKQRAEEALQQPVTKAVITVPAYFNDSQRQATRDAGKLAGLEVLRIVNEPTAASLAYGLGIGAASEKLIAVYDLGGGTFDISILQIENGVFEVLATNGDTFLGGDDVDQAIVDYWLEKNNLAAEEVKNDQSLNQSLRLKAETAKIALSDAPNFSDAIGQIDCSIDRASFEQLIQPLVQRTLKSCQQALTDAELTAADIEEVVLVGGSTRIPLVQKSVEAFFGRKAHKQLDPDQVVALGAAVQADILAGNNKDFLLLDVTPLSLGIETMGGLMDVIIPRNSTLPVKAARQYTTQVDGQANMKIAVYQGERDLVKDNRKLGEFHLKGIPAMPANLPKVQISFIIDADGITRVKAQELRSGVAQSIEVTPQYGLTEAEMGKMLLDSIQFAEQDRSARALQEAIVEAEQIVATTEKFISQNQTHLSKTEITQTQALINTLKATLTNQSSDKDLIHQHIEQLNEYTRPFAERIMDVAIAKAMKGKKV